MDIKQIRTILESPYDRKIWKSFIQTQFTNNKLTKDDAPLNIGKTDIHKECVSLGYYEVNEYTKIGIFEIQLADKVNLTRNRVALRNLIKSITQQVAGAMVVFVQGDKWRFSYISKRKVRNNETNTVEDKETAPKRYTYLFGNGEKALTAAIRFDRLIQKQKGNIYQYLTLNDFEEAFSVEKLSKEFFAQYKEIYDDFVEFITGKRYIKKGSKWVETPTHEAHFQLRNYFNNDEKQARDFFKRMMGRIVFLYFIQKKGWLACSMKNEELKMKNAEVDWGNGDQDYLFNLYANAKYKESFYSDYLVPLFFSTLNSRDGTFDADPKLFINHSSFFIDGKFPYLNGGLFDKAQDYRYDKIALPAQIFDKLFTTFNNYNFTIYEDAPDEHTVAVDPEMLGHIFENLLEDNKDKGAFYTPKDIVHYMCRESLHNYIYTYTGNEENEAFKAKLKLYNDNFDISIFEKNEIKLIDRALEDVKICDPAIGSGAFPMGLLHEIYHLKIPIEDQKGLKAKSPADLKKHIIEESIYGVDIDSGAVDIARLRFWLSLVVDEIAPQPLPNLAFKIVCANTLIPLGNYHGINIAGASEIVNDIAKVREKYFDANKEDKKDLERSFINLQNKLLNTAREWSTKEQAEVYQKIYEFSPFTDKSCTWFDAWWMFGVKDGFDIVIGNPPYGAIIDNDKKFYTTNFISSEGKHEIFKYFIEQGLKMLSNNGTLAFITPDTWTSLGYFKKLRKYIFENYSLQKVTKSLYNVFETATVDTNIILIINSIPTNDYLLVDSDLITITPRTLQDTTDFTLNLKDENLLLNDIEKDKILLDEKCEIWQGLIAYSEKNQPREFTSEEMESEYHRKLLYGGDISKFHIKWSGEYLKYGKWLHRPRPSYIFDDPKILVQRIRNPKLKTRLVCAFDDTGYINGTGLSNILIRKETTDLKLKYLLCLLNSRLINYWFNHYFIDVNIKPEQLRKIPITLVNPDVEVLFIALVDFIQYLLNNKETPQILSHTDNTHIASHFEDILNMMVYELYFEEHMKKVGIDVLQFINPKPIDTLKSVKEKAEVIQEFYEWYQKPDNAVRQRMLLVDTRSKDIIGLINKSV